MKSFSGRFVEVKQFDLFHKYWDFRIKFCCVKKRFGFYFDQSERQNEFLTREKIVSSNHKPRLKWIVFSRAFSRSSRVPLSGSFDKIIFSVYLSKKFVRKRSENSRPQIVFRTDNFSKIVVGCPWQLPATRSLHNLSIASWVNVFARCIEEQFTH